MKEIKLYFDYLSGPIWNDTFDLVSKRFMTGIKVIDDDAELQSLNARAEELYSSLYEFDSHEKPCYFNEKEFKKMKPQLLEIVKEILRRLSDINDGSFTVKDEATPMLKM